MIQIDVFYQRKDDFVMRWMSWFNWWFY